LTTNLQTVLRIGWHKFIAPIDVPLLIICGLILLLAAVVMGSAAPERMGAHLRSLAIALMAMRVMAGIPPHRLMRLAIPLYCFGIVLLVAVALFGDVSKGARRWLDLGFMRGQPSEIMVVATLLLLVPVALIMRQPDLGTSLLVLAAGFYVIFFAGLPWKVLVGLLVSAVATAPVAWSFLHDYQRNRILTLLDPEKDPLGKGFHIIQSTIAIGSGGFLGKGWREGTQSQLEFIPEHHTDFILAVFAEEFGLLGNMLLLTLYGFLIGRGLMIAAQATSLFGRLMAGAITMIFFTYAFVNIGMVSGMLPVVGVPLPFVSYGGTALITLCTGVGILMSIHKNRMLVQK